MKLEHQHRLAALRDEEIAMLYQKRHIICAGAFDKDKLVAGVFLNTSQRYVQDYKKIFGGKKRLGMLRGLVTEKEYRREGLATTLSGDGVGYAIQKDCDIVFCRIHPDSLESIRIYQDVLEFDEHARIKNEHGDPRIIFAKDLDNI